jgi:CRISPR-associated protein Csd1
MNWMQLLGETYDNCVGEVGKDEVATQVPLLPLYHTTQMAQVEIVLDEIGNFRRARLIPKTEARTIIPCTEKSGGRTSGEAPHPLSDKLQYIAGDYQAHGGRKKAYFASYRDQLEKWCASDDAHPIPQAVLAYVQQGHVVGDLIATGILEAGADGTLLSSSEASKKILPIQADAFVRWEVEIPGCLESRAWRDSSLWKSWARYYTSSRTQTDLCYITGEQAYLAEMHPAKIRNDGDKAKLISANDNTDFTFRGRFLTADQAATIGVETTQKAHFALRWLISRQGYRKGDQAIVAWATSGAPVPQPTDDPFALLDGDELPFDTAPTAYTAQEVALKLKQRLAGYGKVLGDTAQIAVIGLGSATTGRLAITYYRTLTSSDFLQRLDDWHSSCAWVHTYRNREISDPTSGKTKKQIVSFIGAPAPSDIAEAAYGRRVDDGLRQATVERLLPCILDGLPLPRDLMEATVRRACNRIALDYWEWHKTLTIACALFRKFNRKENYPMTLDSTRTSRDYLYGRLLALAESLEEWALNQGGEKRETNAARLMQRFAEHPYSTWRTLELALIPYKARLGGKSSKHQRMIDEVVAAFQRDDFVSDKRLSGEFLLGYHCQRVELRRKVGDGQTDPEAEASNANEAIDSFEEEEGE